MIGNHGFDRVCQKFAAQFEPDGNGFVYRKYAKDAPIPVNASERDKYIEDFNRSTKFRLWAVAGATILFILALSFYQVKTSAGPSGLPIYCGLAVILGAYLISHYWAWNRPARELRDRGAIGEARSRVEMKQRSLARLTYGEIAAAAVTPLLLLLQVDLKRDLFSGWNLFWLVLVAAILCLVAVQAYRKWRFDSQGSTEKVP